MKKVLIANRGEIAVRIIRGLHEMGIAAVAVYSAADAAALHVQCADEAVYIGEPPPAKSYLNGTVLVEKALEVGADAIHPGYGFLSESPDFARQCAEGGIAFIGPPPEVLDRAADKRALKSRLADQGFPVLPGSEPAADPDAARSEADRLGYPVLLKAASGGGGRGIRVIRDAEDLAGAFEAAMRETRLASGSEVLFVEKYIANPRHVEVQVLADRRGSFVHLHERECSVQRRYQKVLEESPSPALTGKGREELCRCALEIMRSIEYENAGTVEFLLDGHGNFHFMEVNPRIQVEHPVTEMVTGVDLVKWQVRVASGAKLDFQSVPLLGHAIECRICAEDPAHGFRPSPGRVAYLEFPRRPGVRVDPGVCQGYVVPSEYDPLLAKVIAFGRDREEARQRMAGALRQLRIAGPVTTAEFLLDLVQDEAFVRGDLHTGFIRERLGSWQPGREHLWEALAAAAVIEEEKGQVAERILRDEGSVLSPWRRLGRWRLGKFRG
jgi:acetyl-CoA carboxylase biotin carboxylase subunit